jgi:hypothetical protein
MFAGAGTERGAVSSIVRTRMRLTVGALRVIGLADGACNDAFNQDEPSARESP